MIGTYNIILWIAKQNAYTHVKEIYVGHRF